MHKMVITPSHLNEWTSVSPDILSSVKITSPKWKLKVRPSFGNPKAFLALRIMSYDKLDTEKAIT